MVTQIPELGPLADVAEVLRAAEIPGITDRVPDEAELAEMERGTGPGARELLRVEMLEGLSGGVEMQLMLAATRALDAGADPTLINRASLDWFTGAGCRDAGTQVALLQTSVSHLSNLLMVLTAEGRRGTAAEVPLIVMHALTVAGALKNMLAAASDDAGYRELAAAGAESLRSAAELLEQAAAMARMPIPVDERFTGAASTPKRTRRQPRRRG